MAVRSVRVGGPSSAPAYTALTAHPFNLGADGTAGNSQGEMTSYVAGPPVRNEYSSNVTGPFDEATTMKIAAKGGGTFFGGNIAHGSDTFTEGDSIWWRVYHYFPTAYCQGDQGGGDQVAFLKWLAIYFDDGGSDARRLTFQIGGGVPTNSCALASAAPTMKHVATEALGTGSPLNLAWGTEQLIPRDQWVALQWMAYLHDENNGYVRAWMDDTYLGQANGRTISSNASYRTIAKMKFGDYWNGTCYQDTLWYVSQMIFTKEAPNTLDSGGRPYIHPSHKAEDV